MSQTNQTQGLLAELLVLSDLISKGHNAFLASGNLTFDLVVEIKSRLYRVQVKSTQKRTSPLAYCFNNRRGKDRRYLPTDYDFLALVARDTSQVAYILPTEKVKISIRDMSVYPIEKLLKDL